jgi:hypothetical protein
MSILEFFRSNHCDEQINEEEQRNNRDDGRFHFGLLQFLAKTYVECAAHKKRSDDAHKDEVAHKITLTLSESRVTALIKLHAKCVKNLLTP